MKKTIHYALILDQSGSMQDLKDVVITSFNEQVEMIRKLQKKEPDVEIKITLCIFNDEVDFKYTCQNLDYLQKLTSTDYQPNSCTALYDAMGITMLKIHEIMQPKDQVFLAIFTDGLENASKNYTAKDIRLKLKMVEKEGWEIQFFCRYEDADNYRQKLDLSDNVCFQIIAEPEGIKLMEKQINFCLDRMVKSKKES